MTITSSAWWLASLWRALRTALVVALPYLGLASVNTADPSFTMTFQSVPWLQVLSAAGLGFVLSYVTSLAGLAEASGASVPTWLALLERVTKTVAQAFVAGIGNAVLFQTVDWPTVAQSAALAGLGSLLLGLMASLPEASSTTVTVSAQPPIATVSVSPGTVPTAAPPLVVDSTSTPSVIAK